jgi:septum site-determining protein MinD
MSGRILALVGAAGGAGTTRLAVECGATLARTGREVAVFDAAYGTQGLADYVDGELTTDVTALVTGEADLEAALYRRELDVPGGLTFCPARAPFERLARAKTAGAAEQLEEQLAAAALSHDVVIVDVPPIASNQAVAAVDAADRVTAVVPDSERGGDALARLRGRLSDVGSSTDVVVANFADDGPAVAADARVPTSEAVSPVECPACLPPDEEFAPAVAAATAVAAGVGLDLTFPESGRLETLLDGRPEFLQ